MKKPSGNRVNLAKKNLIAAIEKAVEDNNVKTMTADLRYAAEDGQIGTYEKEDVAAVLLHLKKNQDDYQAFVEKLQDESVTVGEEDGVPYLLLTDFKCLSLSDPVLCLSLVVLLCCHTKNFFERVNNIFLTYFSWCKYDFPVFNSPGCLHDHVIACFNFIIFRTEIINLAYITKSYAYYFCHSISP